MPLCVRADHGQAQDDAETAAYGQPQRPDRQRPDADKASGRAAGRPRLQHRDADTQGCSDGRFLRRPVHLRDT